MVRKPRGIDISGQVFGNWLVLYRDGVSPNNGALFMCLCVCGTKTRVTSNALRQGKSNSCGCTARRKYKASSYNSQYNSHKLSCKKRNLSALGYDLWLLISSLPCVYCGGTDTRVSSNVRNSSNSIKDSYSIQINGVDRVDSSLDYVEGNCVPCCGKCNLMKYTNSPSEFINHISKIFNYISTL